MLRVTKICTEKSKKKTINDTSSIHTQVCIKCIYKLAVHKRLQSSSLNESTKPVSFVAREGICIKTKHKTFSLET